MRQDTLFIERVALVGKIGEGRNGQGEGLSRVLTMVKIAPLGIASRR